MSFMHELLLEYTNRLLVCVLFNGSLPISLDAYCKERNVTYRTKLSCGVSPFTFLRVSKSLEMGRIPIEEDVMISKRIIYNSKLI
jgi:hypothetical protein